MSKIPVGKVATEENLPLEWSDQLRRLSEQVQNKAFELFERQGRTEGDDLAHWFQAEKQMLNVPRSVLLDEDANLEVHIAVPGFDAREIEVIALPEALLVNAQASQEREQKTGALHYAEFNDESLFRRIPLPETVDVDRVTAKLEKGVLKVIAPKKQTVTESATTVATGG